MNGLIVKLSKISPLNTNFNNCFMHFYCILFISLLLDDVGVVESVKAVNEICSPVSGTITEVNTKLEDKPSLINESCYDEGKLSIKMLQIMLKFPTSFILYFLFHNVLKFSFISLKVFHIFCC